ncbi:hypothetical protein IAR50_006534 [Cryptococcus sp. DSM 104548]
MGLFRSSSGLRFNPLWHSLSILLTFVSFLMLMILVFYNAPIDHVESSLSGRMGLRMWMLTINETDSTYPTWAGSERSLITHSTEILQSRTDLEVLDEAPRWSGTIDKRIGRVANLDGGLHAYGFGIWGWCEWTNTKWRTGDARCTKKMAYKLPESADSEWDSLYDLELP